MGILGEMRGNKTRKVHRGGDCRVGVLNPWWGGKSKPSNTLANNSSILSVAESLVGGGCSTPKPQMMNLPAGGACPCQAVPKISIPLDQLQKEGYKGGYRATKRNLKYLKRWKQGKSIGFTMKSSLKAKGLIPRANRTKKVSPKYKK